MRLSPAALAAAAVLVGGAAADREDDRAAAGAAAAPRPQLEQEATGTDEAPLADPATVEAFERGLAWLAAAQARRQDGSLPSGTEAGGDESGYVPIAATALAALAWMAGGSTPERGPYGREVARAIDYLLHNTDLSEGSPEQGYVSAPAAVGRIHAHGYATLAFSQAYATSPSTPRGRRLEEALRAGVHLIERTQGSEGGWWYEPRRSIHHENSTTITLVQALRGARNAGIAVDRGVIARAIAYVKRTQNEDGGFRYGIDQDLVTVGLTAAAISTLNATGEYSGPEIDAGMEWIWRRLELRAQEPARPRFPYYERLYLAQALWQNPDPRVFERWWREAAPRLTSAQSSTGSWQDATYGDGYATAMSCLVLALPLGELPIFQR